EWQIDPVEQRLGIKFSGLTSLADRCHDSGRCKRKAREALNVALGDTLSPRNVGQRAHPAGSDFFKPCPGTRHSLEQSRVYLARQIVSRRHDDSRLNAA